MLFQSASADGICRSEKIICATQRMVRMPSRAIPGIMLLTVPVATPRTAMM